MAIYIYGHTHEDTCVYICICAYTSPGKAAGHPKRTPQPLISIRLDLWAGPLIWALNPGVLGFRVKGLGFSIHILYP